LCFALFEAAVFSAIVRVANVDRLDENAQGFADVLGKT